MRRFRILLGAGAMLAAMLSLIIPATASATAAAPPGTQPRSPFPTAVLMSKQVLNETSIDGPALSSVVDNFEGVHLSTVIAWTGIDPAHHLNLLRSHDSPAKGALTFGEKRILRETSFARPAVLELAGGIGATVVAWTGTDPAHTVNLMWDAYGTQQKLTLWGHSSIGAPALAFFNGKIALAWTGTDPNHSLNVMLLTVGNLAHGGPAVLRQFSSLTGPDLAVFSNATSTRLAISWTTTAQHLNLATSTNGVTFASALGAGTPQLSASAPAVLYHQSEGFPEYWMAWTGTDPAHHLNLQLTVKYPQWPDPAATKTVLGDTALGGPQIQVNDGHLIAWTGTDPAHHLNLAQWDIR